MPRAISPRNDRYHATRSVKPGDNRSPAQRDRDRILYSSAFRRLAEVTQVVAASSGYVFHNRLTHSLQVAQVARRLAEKLNFEHPETTQDPSKIDPDVAEAAAMAHDLGHPPFGHVIEKELDELAKDIGGFEGNAQSFRIICKLAFHSPEYPGLNLTRSTLAAILKYPWLKNQNSAHKSKWGAYDSEKLEFKFARDGCSGFNQTPEAFLMDWADDITYSVHDLEDFYRAGRIPLHLLASSRDDTERKYFFDNVFLRNPNLLRKRSALETAFRDLLFATFSSTQPYRGTQRERSQLRSFTGALVDRYIQGLLFTRVGKRSTLNIRKELKEEVFMLKQLTWTYVIEAPALATQQLGQRNMVRTLFEAYKEAAKKKNWKLFPPYYQEKLNEAKSKNDRIRICVDLIAGMTEAQVYRIYSRITGSTAQSSLLDPLA